MVTLSYILGGGGGFKNQMQMVSGQTKTACGLSFQLTKGRIDDGIEDGC